MEARDAFYGPNVGYVLELYEQYQKDPDSVDPGTRAFFEQLGANGAGAALATLARPSTTGPTASSRNGAGTRPASTPPRTAKENEARAAGETPLPQGAVSGDVADKIVRAARMARSIREYGHLAANIDPLEQSRPGDPMLDPATHHITEDDLRALPATIVWPGAGPEAGSCLDAIERLREIYSGSTGYEFDHVQDYSERKWLHETVEGETFRQPLAAEKLRDLLRRLTEVEAFEQFLHKVFVGQKRFSIEGNDTLIPMLDELIHQAVQSGTREVLIGMAHRGRLSVLAHVLEKSYTAIFSEFHSPQEKSGDPTGESSSGNQGWTGDVKYHLGGQRRLLEGKSVQVEVTLADNPSHLEFVNPVVEGFGRAAQDRRDKPGEPEQDPDAALCVTIHGDAAFPGEGVTAETLNLSHLPGYQTGGSVRIIVNNQIGFTTGARQGRSTLYASDLAKGFEIPIVHVNADDPEACVSVMQFAHAYRDRFKKDFLIDLVGYRRWGHNEGDEPTFTQPRLYARVTPHRTVRDLYAEKLVSEGVVSREQAESMRQEVQQRLQQAREESSTAQPSGEEGQEKSEAESAGGPRAVSAAELQAMNEALLTYPPSFKIHPRLKRLLERRREAIEKPDGVDWGLAESLAFATILADRTPIRLTGQDTERGTFSQRHLVLHGEEAGSHHVPLQTLPQAKASFAVYNSPLSEAATIGFEYGYSVHAPEALVLWEAQFGDFTNAGQVLVDQFIVSARAKWRQEPSLVLLLPHGYEGQGPDHSNARIERFLQLAAEDNLRLVNCTSAAQYFHVLRLQAATLDTSRRPLVIMTPKSLLRQPLASSNLADLSSGTFQPVIDDEAASHRKNAVERLIFCSGKVAVDLTTTSKSRPEPVDWVAVVRVEQLYPFPKDMLKEVISSYPDLREAIWLQEEPSNMGAWTFMAPRLQEVLPEGITLDYLGRSERASTAEGDPDAHQAEQTRVLQAAFGGERRVKIETIEVHDVS